MGVAEAIGRRTGYRSPEVTVYPNRWVLFFSQMGHFSSLRATNNHVRSLHSLENMPMASRPSNDFMGFVVQESFRAKVHGPQPRKVVVRVERERMERALSSPSIMIPGGLTPDEVREFILRAASSTGK